MTKPEDPPYVRIVADVRRRIASGELRPGDRLPSTRELARTWKVAVATAAHALKTLAAEGAVQSMPRQGNVVAGGRPPLRARDAELSRARVVEAAMAICDRDGLSALSIRGVAAHLGVPPMSLYRHVESKEDLLREMTDVALGEDPLPTLPPPGWRAQLEMAARFEWRTFKRHPWLARVVNITRPEPLVSAIAFAEWVLRALESLDMPAAERMQVHILLHSFVQGLASNLEAEADAARDTGLTEAEWMGTRDSGFQALAASGRFPAFARTFQAVDDGAALEVDRLFEVGLTMWLDGVGRSRKPKRRAR